MGLSVRDADETTIEWTDRLAILWVVLWLIVGILAAVTIWRIAGIGDTISTSGQALDTAGRAINRVASVPVIGDQAGELGDQVVTTSAEVSSRGQEVKGELRQLAVLLGIFLVLVPTLPVLALYLPARLRRRRELEQLRGALGERHRDLDVLLAHRALDNLTVGELRSMSVETGGIADQVRPLADAELARLGLRRP